MDEALGVIIWPIRFDYSIQIRIVTPDSIWDSILMQTADLQVPKNSLQFSDRQPQLSDSKISIE